MKTNFIAGLCLAFIFDSIDLSLHTDPSRNGRGTHGIPKDVRSSSGRRSPDTTLSLVSLHFSPTSSHGAERPSRPAAPRGRTPPDRPPSNRRSPDTNLSLAVSDSSARSRSRSPALKHPPPFLFGYPLKELRFLQLISYINPNWRFQIRPYIFPPDKQIQILTEHDKYAPIFNVKLMVLSDSHGDVFGFLKDKEEGQIALRLYLRTPRGHDSVKINIKSGVVVPLTTAEMSNFPLDNTTPIIYSFQIIHTERSARMQTTHSQRNNQNRESGSGQF